MTTKLKFARLLVAAAGFGALVGSTPITPASAAPFSAPAPSLSTDPSVTPVQYYGYDHPRYYYPGAALRRDGWYPGAGLREEGWYPGAGLERKEAWRQYRWHRWHHEDDWDEDD